MIGYFGYSIFILCGECDKMWDDIPNGFASADQPDLDSACADQPDPESVVESDALDECTSVSLRQVKVEVMVVV